MRRGARRLDVFFSADHREEYLNLLSQSASKHGLDFLVWLMSDHARFVVVPRQERLLARTFGKRIADTRGWSREGWIGALGSDFDKLTI